MDQHTLTVLEFHKIRELVAEMAISELGQRKCRALMPVERLETARSLQQESAQMRSFRAVSGDLPLEGLRDIQPALRKSRAQGVKLLPQELLEILSTLESMHRTAQRLMDGGAEYPLLHVMGTELTPLPQLETRIRHSIGPRNEILDTASPELEKIRSDIVRLKNRIKRQLESILSNERYKSAIQDRIITIRNDRFVIPVRADHRPAIPGIVHDRSQSRATFFIEPLVIVDANNELNLLYRSEREEEQRILAELTALVGQKADILDENVSLLSKIDTLHAIARWAEYLKCTTPLLDQSHRVDILAARHPLLVHRFCLEGREDKVVPIDIRFGGEQRTLIISGANTGGKTVALKTLGLMALMAQSGIPIPAAEGSSLPVFRHIMADIGDEQDLEKSLSTFSAHVRRLVDICEVVDSNSLVLLDEIGVGTDPEEGAAVALSILDYLRERNVFVAATTHFNAVKTYAYQHADVINASVAFDHENMQPLYQLIYGIPGQSNAMLVLADLGVPEPILMKAETYRSDDQKVAARLIQDFQETHRSMELHLREFRQIRADSKHILSRLEEILSRMIRRRDELLKKFEREARDVIRRGRVEIRRIVKELSESRQVGASRHWKEVEAIRQEMISALKASYPDPQRLSQPPVRGQIVAIQSLGGLEGNVTQIDTEGDAVEVQVGAMKVNTHLDDLAVPSIGAAGRQKRHYRGTVILPPKKEPLHSLSQVNIIGMTVEEALPVVDKHIDDAILSGMGRLRIVHGHGSGRLRQAVQAHLREHRYVATFEFGAPEEGGSGATVVHLKD
ncbi:MAG: endonuclease MutS2 [Deltaproteobacteria bacterium]|nr:endonuclease MutS2 [Deltaproteobacteria bacterium]